jgi:hypothetical protein
LTFRDYSNRRAPSAPEEKHKGVPSNQEGRMNGAKDTEATEFEVDEQELWRRSDQIIETIAELTNLDVDKREALPGTEAFVGTARSVRQTAQILLDLTGDEERLAERLHQLRPRAQAPATRRTPGAGSS